MTESPGSFKSGIYYSPDSGGGTGGPSKPKIEPEGEHRPEDEAEAQRYRSRESLSDELINMAETPEELFIGLRQLEKQLEDSNIPPNLSERYTPPRQLAAMYERADMMGYTIDDLTKQGWIKDYSPETGEAKLKDRRFAAIAVTSEQIDKIDSTGRLIGYEVKYNFGTPESRKNLEKAYRRAIVELEARDIINEHTGLRLNLDFRDSLEELTAMMHSGRMPKFKPDHLEAIFNMPSIAELGSNPENKQLGDQVEEAIFLNLVMLNSGSKQRMLDFLERPGAKHLIAKMAKEEETRRGTKYRYEDWVKDNIGDVSAWVDDYIGTVDPEDPEAFKKTRDIMKTWRYETDEKKVRGTLTQWSNIAAWGGKPTEFGHDKETEFIEKTVGGLVGSVEASWVAAAVMKSAGVYASEGYVTLPNGKSHLPLGEGRFISGDDTGKFWAYMFNMKEGLKGRRSGLKDMIGRIPDTAMNLFDWAQVKMPDLKNSDESPAKRSIWDAWLGTAKGKPIKNLLTSEVAKDDNGDPKVTPEEPYHRLGDLNFRSLEREFHGTFTVMQWLLGNREGPTGVFIDAMKTKFGPDEFSLDDPSGLKAKWKYIGIVMNQTVLTKGSQHLYDDLEKKIPETISTDVLTKEGKVIHQTREVKLEIYRAIQWRFFRNLMAARIRSNYFGTEILPKVVPILNPRAGEPTFLEIPIANLFELYINEILAGNPEDEDGLIAHYVDDFIRMGGVEFKKSKVGAIREKARSWFTNQVGKVTGRKS